MRNDDKKCAGTNGMSGDNRVGYRHPPRHSQFKPGRSGNPSGRPKHDASLSFMPELAKELAQFCENNSDVRITNKTAIVKQLIAATRANDPYLAIALIGLCEKLRRGQKKHSRGEEADPRVAEDEAFAEQLAARESQAVQGEATISAPSTEETRDE